MKIEEYGRVAARLRIPAVLLLSAIALGLVSRFMPGDPRLIDILELAARILMVLAVGIAIMQIGLLGMDRRLMRLDLSVSDNLDARRRATRLNMLRRIWIITLSVLIFATALTANFCL